MKKAMKVVIGTAALGGAFVAGDLIWKKVRDYRHRKQLDKDFMDAFEDEYEDDEDLEEDFFDEDLECDEKEEKSPYIPDYYEDGKEIPKSMLYSNHMEYLDYSVFLIQKRCQEMMDRLKDMYSLVSRRNIKAEEKEKQLKSMALANMDDCRVISTSSEGMQGVFHKGCSADFNIYFIMRDEAIDQLQAEEDSKDE